MRLTINTIIFASLLASTASFAELLPMSNIAMAKQSGQGVIEVSETLAGVVAQPGGTDTSFTRITIGADISINANISRLVLGEGVRPDGIDNSNGLATADIDFMDVSLGTIDPDGTVHDFQIVDPYVEFARDTSGNLIGFRLGFGEVYGTLGLEITTLSGDVQVVGELWPITLDSWAHSIREDDIASLIGLASIDLGNFKKLEFNNANNMYLGLQSTAINYPKLGAGPQGTAQAGFWLNLQDGVTAPDLFFGFFPLPGTVQNSHPVNRFTGYL